MTPRTLTRIGLIGLGVGQAVVGAWALLDTRGWFENFPGTGDAWLPAFGAYNDHLAIDVGSAFLGLGVLLIAAAVIMDRRLTTVALAAYLVYDVPHWIFHLGNDGVLSDGDRIANGALLTVSVLTAAGLLWLSRRAETSAIAAGSAARGGGTKPSSNGISSRLSPPPGGPIMAGARWYSRHSAGGDLAPVEAFGHHRKLLMGYGTLEMATERSHSVDHRLKSLAACRAAAVVQCEWCMDFGSSLALEGGLTEDELRDLATYDESERFSALDRLVLDYATAMSRTPAAVDDDLFARLREHFTDKQLIELTNEIAIENYRARANHALGLEPQGFSEGRVCIVPANV